MTFLQIRYFIEVATLKSVTKAADKLYVSEQAVSKQLKSLERELGFPLIYQSNRQTEMTSSGEKLFQIWEPMLLRTDAALAQIKRENNQTENILRIGILEYENVLGMVMPLLAEYGKAHPERQIEILTGSPKRLLDYAKTGQIDLLITFSAELPDTISLDWVYVFHRMHLAIIMSASHPLAAKKDLDITDLKDECFFILEENHSIKAQESILSHCRSKGFEPRVRFFKSPESIQVELMLGKGVTLSFIDLFRNSSHSLVSIPTPYKSGHEATHLVCASLTKENKQIAGRLADMLREKQL